MKKRIISAAFISAAIFLSGCSDGNAPDSSDSQVVPTSDNITEEQIVQSLDNGKIIDSVSRTVFKTERNANPLSPDIFCADPTAVEYEGRLYVYGTNDHEQSENDTKNDYDHIRSLVCFSTDDMVNWVYHGRIEVGEIAPWIYNSWAPSIASRVEADGLTHFYLYFSNSGNGVGVITATSPTGPWSDPLGAPLVYQNMPGLENCPAPFDPGVCIDENGIGWLSFGGGAPSNSGKVHSNIPKVARLGADMLSFDSEFVSIDAPYFFEASELNYLDGIYYYSYSTDWQTRGAGWDYEGIKAPPVCSMAYLTTKTPLDADSWEYKGAFFYNSGQNSEGDSGMRWGNNHTHFMEYCGVNYILHHTLLLEELQGGSAGFRSLMVDYLPMNENGEIPITAATRRGAAQIKPLDPYTKHNAATIFTSAEIGYEKIGEGEVSVKNSADGSWIYVRGVDFGYGAENFIAEVKGKGRIEVRLDDMNAAPAASIDFDNAEYSGIKSTDFAEFDGRNHNVYFVMSGDVSFKSWQFTKSGETLRPEEPLANEELPSTIMVISGQAENPGGAISATVEITKNGDYTVKASSFEYGSEVINLGFINPEKDAKFKVLVRSLTLETKSGSVEVPVNVELDPSSSTGNGLANCWQGAKIGDLIYGDESKGIYAAEASSGSTGYHLALKINGEEIPYCSVTYHITITDWNA